MFFIYNIVVLVAAQAVQFLAFFSPKMKQFVVGRKNLYSILKDKINPGDKTIWFHAASLGEYEQGLPVMEAIKLQFPSHKIVLTFFSPSGFEVRKNNSLANVTVYLPLDSQSNAKRFLELVQPEMVFFIKYEFWPNYLNEIKKKKIRAFLISGIFRKNQAFFKWYGGFYRNALQAFEYFFVQNENSKELLESIGFNNVKISGDTRFDRVATILDRDNTLEYIKEFKNDLPMMVVGSSWPLDDEIIVSYINSTSKKVKFIIAPHNIKENQINSLKSKIQKKVGLFSEKEKIDLVDCDVFIVDTIGILTKIYSYATIAYVGGGFGNPGVHNILEPATFGIPILIGPNFTHFAEAIELVSLGGCTSISNQKEFEEITDFLIENASVRKAEGLVCEGYVRQNEGATQRILNHILS
jgi:3-deoxy-D-manno-octulosonic-acid transferase